MLKGPMILKLSSSRYTMLYIVFGSLKELSKWDMGFYFYFSTFNINSIPRYLNQEVGLSSNITSSLIPAKAF